MTGFQAPRGTRDWFGEAAARRQAVVDAARSVFDDEAGYTRIVTPTFEDTGVFARTSGEGSDVVRKEMYTFEDRSGRSLTLRPEGTAGVVRAYIEHGMSRLPQPVRMWYLAPMFRYAAVQRGRYREHYQFGVEAIGSDDPAVDAEVIALQAEWYRRCGITAVELQLNSIGDATCRPAYTALLVAFLDDHLDELCDECRERRDTNPLRVFDCKNASCQAVLRAAPLITDHLCDACREHFASVRSFLEAAGVAHAVTPTLVRGLDYYMRTAWEFVTTELGAQGTIGGGGRYDGLSEQLGGPPAPGVGFGSGVERVMEVGHAEPAEPGGLVMFVVVAAEARPRLYALMAEVRRRGRRAEAVFGGRNLRRQLEAAAKRGAAVAAIVGEDEWAAGEATLRDMASGEQRRVPLDGLVGELGA
jgi:histidyl-tRNA synthetase